jgi:hypothetical protein
LLLAASPTVAELPAGPVTVVGGHADWGVKSSFRAYVTGPVAQGTIELEDGATANVDESFRLPDPVGTSSSGDLDVSFGGSIRFTGHGGALDMTMTDIGVEIEGTSGTLRADVTTKSFDSGAFDTYDDVAFADLDLAGVTPTEADGRFTWSTLPATLTAAGAEAFSDFYTAGTDLDPITVSVSFEGGTPTTPNTPPTTTGPTTTTPPTTTPPTITPPTTAGPTTIVPEADPHAKQTIVSGNEITKATTATTGALPATGVDVRRLALVAVALLAVGALLLTGVSRGSVARGSSRGRPGG